MPGARVWRTSSPGSSGRAGLRQCFPPGLSMKTRPPPKVPCRFPKTICRFGGQISPCLWVGKSARPLTERVNTTKHKIMNANRNGNMPEGAAARGKSTRTTWTLAQGAIDSGRGMVLAILALGPIVGLGLIPAGRVTAQTFTTLHSFTAYPNYTNTDGAKPNGLLLSGNILYGTAVRGGGSVGGTVLRGHKPGHKCQSVSFVPSRRNVRNLLWSLHLGVTPVQFRGRWQCPSWAASAFFLSVPTNLHNYTDRLTNFFDIFCDTNQG